MPPYLLPYNLPYLLPNLLPNCLTALPPALPPHRVTPPQLLSLPGHSFAVGFKYTMLCSSAVVRGAHPAAGCEGCPRVFDQWWSAGLQVCALAECGRRRP